MTRSLALLGLVLIGACSTNNLDLPPIDYSAGKSDRCARVSAFCEDASAPVITDSGLDAHDDSGNDAGTSPIDASSDASTDASTD